VRSAGEGFEVLCCRLLSLEPSGDDVWEGKRGIGSFVRLMETRWPDENRC
jgi:hypothetical protein